MAIGYKASGSARPPELGKSGTTSVGISYQVQLYASKAPPRARHMPGSLRDSAVHVAFVALYNGDSWVASVERVSRHLNATGPAHGQQLHNLDASGPTRGQQQSLPPVQFHAIVQSTAASAPSWLVQHEIRGMPDDARVQHKNLSHGKPHGAYVFLWKAFLYRLLPLEKVIVLDLDIVLGSGARLQRPGVA